MTTPHTTETPFRRPVDPVVSGRLRRSETATGGSRRLRRVGRHVRDSRDPPEAPLVASFLDTLPAGTRLLDVGCGQGTPVLDRCPVGVEAVGLDVSAEQLRRASTTDASLVRGDMTALPVADTRVDAVTALHSLIHVPDAEQPRVLAEVARVTRPGARVLLTAGTDPWTGVNDDWLDSGVRMEWSVPGVETTRERLAEAGFRVTDEEFVSDELDDDGGGWLFLTAERRGD